MLDSRCSTLFGVCLLEEIPTALMAYGKQTRPLRLDGLYGCETSCWSSAVSDAGWAQVGWTRGCATTNCLGSSISPCAYACIHGCLGACLRSSTRTKSCLLSGSCSSSLHSQGSADLSPLLFDAAVWAHPGADTRTIVSACESFDVSAHDECRLIIPSVAASILELRNYFMCIGS